MSKAYERRHDDSDSDSDGKREDRKMEKLYKKMKKMMMCDPELMVTGAETYADIYNTATQSIAMGGTVTMEFNDSLVHFEHVPNTGDVIVKKNGVYLVLLSLNINDPTQWTIYVNGIPHVPSTAGTNGGAVVFNTYHIMALACGDIVTVRNYSSPKATTLTVNAGGDGSVGSTNAELVFVKIAPYCPPMPKPQK